MNKENKNKILEPIMIQGEYGDFWLSCPICGEHFTIPQEIFWKSPAPKKIPCKKCGQLLKVL